MSNELFINDLNKVKELSSEVYDFITDKARCNVDIPNGRIDFSDGCYGIVSSYETKPRDDKEYESHRKYIDVQMLLKGSEYIEVAPITSLTVTKDYSEENDVMFFSNAVKGDNIVLESMNPVILLPETGHMPGVINKEAETVKKIVFKVPVRN